MSGGAKTYPHVVEPVVVDAELDEDRDDDDGELAMPTIPTLDKRKLDRAFANARAVAEPVIEILYLATATFAAGRIAYERAKRAAKKRARIAASPPPSKR